MFHNSTGILSRERARDAAIPAAASRAAANMTLVSLSMQDYERSRAVLDYEAAAETATVATMQVMGLML